MFHSFSIIYLLNHSAKFVVLCCQSNTKRIRVVLKVFDRTKIACTNFSVKDRGIAGMNDTDLFQLTLTPANEKMPDQVAYSVHLTRWRIALQCSYAEFGQSGALAFYKYDFQFFQKTNPAPKPGFLARCVIRPSAFFIFLWSKLIEIGVLIAFRLSQYSLKIQLMLYILVIFARYLKCGIKYDLYNLAQWLSSNGYFIYMENSLFFIVYYVYPRSISIGIMTGCHSILSTRTLRM